MIHSKKSNKKPYVIIMIILFSLFIGFNLVIIIPALLSRNQNFYTTTNAIENECSYCLNEPPCCADIRKTGDATACSWPIRGYCTLATCGQAQGKQQRCGWYWIWHDAGANSYDLGTNSEKGYGCMVGMTEATMQPRCTPDGEITLSQINATPTPTPTPLITPTAIPTPTTYNPPISPTVQLVEPNNAGYSHSKETLLVPPNDSNQPTINPFPTVTESNNPSGLQLPQLQLPSISFLKTSIDLMQINSTAQKPLGLFEGIFLAVVNYDRLLEQTINTHIRLMLPQ